MSSYRKLSALVIVSMWVALALTSCPAWRASAQDSMPTGEWFIHTSTDPVTLATRTVAAYIDPADEDDFVVSMSCMDDGALLVLLDITPYVANDGGLVQVDYRATSMSEATRARWRVLGPDEQTLQVNLPRVCEDLATCTTLYDLVSSESVLHVRVFAYRQNEDVAIPTDGLLSELTANPDQFPCFGPPPAVEVQEGSAPSLVKP